MRHHPSLQAILVLAAVLAFQPSARADDETRVDTPAVVAYVAPFAECASTEAFQQLLVLEIAHSPRLAETWRYAIVIRRDQGEFEGTLTTETSVRVVRAALCDDVTAALAVMIARSDAEVLAPLPPPRQVAPVPPPSSERSRVPTMPTGAPEWRLGARAQGWSHGYQGKPSFGGMGLLSIELPWGLRKTMFEVGAGAMVSDPLTYYVVDTQACPLDWPLGQSGVTLLGCGRVAGAAFKASDGFGTQGGALWFGAGGRLRWQPGSSFFVELHLNGVYGTVSSGESNQPAWVDAGATVGFRL